MVVDKSISHACVSQHSKVDDERGRFCESVQVYQSLDRELQRHVSLRDTLQQCQTWLFNIQEELQPPAQTPRYLEEALIQVHTSQTQLSFISSIHIMKVVCN